MGTYYNVKIRTDNEDNLLNNDILKVLDSVVNKMSMFDSNSEISKINNNTTGDWIEVSPELAEVLKKSDDVYKKSNGGFDPTVGKLVNLWGFGTSKTAKIPDQAEIKEVLKYTGFNKLKFSNDYTKIKKTDPQIYIDLSAIAKGYGVDKVAELLISKGYEDFVVEIGGEVRAQGMKSSDKSWIIGVMRPLKGKFENEYVLKLNNYSVATSGDYRNYYDVDGNTFSHTINSRTGYPIKNNVASVTVFRKSCMEADALATAIISMDPEKAIAFANERGIITILFVRKSDDNFKIMMSEKAKTYIAQNELKQVQKE